MQMAGVPSENIRSCKYKSEIIVKITQRKINMKATAGKNKSARYIQ